MYQPLVLNPKSDKPVAEAVKPLIEAKVPVYSLIGDSLMRYYTVNYYLGDQLLRVESAPKGKLQPPFAILTQEKLLPDIKTYVTADCDTIKLSPWSCDNRRDIILCKFEK